MNLLVRAGSAADIRQATDLLNEIISIGGTTARTEQTTAVDLGDWLTSDPEAAYWCVAEEETGALLGFQWIGLHPDLPHKACDISTFVKAGRAGLGVGSQLFEATKQAALDLGYDWINANIRADNEGGLIYYQSRGFRAYDRIENVTLADGSKVNKILKRYDLKD